LLPAGPGGGKTEQLDAITLRDVIEHYGLEQIAAVKLDIEGAEYGVIESSVDIIGKIGARWAVELHADPFNLTPIDVDRVRRIFDRAGYATILQQSSEIAAMPTLFAFPPTHVLRP
jgi:hypothetical protein